MASPIPRVPPVTIATLVICPSAQLTVGKQKLGPPVSCLVGKGPQFLKLFGDPLGQKVGGFAARLHEKIVDFPGTVDALFKRYLRDSGSLRHGVISDVERPKILKQGLDV